jgi:hypothetical protein
MSLTGCWENKKEKFSFGFYLMVHPEQIQSFFPAQIRYSPAHRKYMLKEYIQLMIPDYLSNTPFVRKIVFVGGTGLRPDRKSCKNKSLKSMIF